jgi:hypothetical protein
MAPTYAVPMLDRAGITLQDFDIYEIHEAFAAQVPCNSGAWESAPMPHETQARCAARRDRSRQANLWTQRASHPFAATGAHSGRTRQAAGGAWLGAGSSRSVMAGAWASPRYRAPDATPPSAFDPVASPDIFQTTTASSRYPRQLDRPLFPASGCSDRTVVEIAV